MYDTHQPMISAWARQSPENTCKVLQFCIVSARERFYNMPTLLEEARAYSPSVLFGWKLGAYHHFEAEAEAIAWNLEDIYTLYGQPPKGQEMVFANRLVCYLSSLPGLGFAKGGFAAQLIYGVSGCLDTVNLETLDVNVNVTKRGSPNAKLATYYRRVAHYNETIDILGGGPFLWDHWCHAQAIRYPKVWATGEECSAFHVECLIGE